MCVSFEIRATGFVFKSDLGKPQSAESMDGATGIFIFLFIVVLSLKFYLILCTANSTLGPISSENLGIPSTASCFGKLSTVVFSGIGNAWTRCWRCGLESPPFTNHDRYRSKMYALQIRRTVFDLPEQVLMFLSDQSVISLLRN